MKVVWTDFAIKNLQDFFDYYAFKVNKKLAHKIRKQILKSSRQLIKNPNSCPIEPNLKILNKNHRYLVCGHYKLIYRVVDDEIIINDIFDTRQNPAKIRKENRRE